MRKYEATAQEFDAPLSETLLAAIGGSAADAAQASMAGLPVDLAACSDEVLAALISAAQAEREQRKKKRTAAFLSSIQEQARQLGIDPLTLVAALRRKPGVKATRPDAGDGRSVVRPKFQNPQDPKQQWSGRGARPKWFLEHLAAGGTEEALRAPEGQK